MTKRLLALTLLQQAGDRGVTTGELLQAGVGSRYGARILELREDGHTIQTARIRDGSFRYTLMDSASGWDAGREPLVQGDRELRPAGAAAPLFDHVGGLTRNAIYGTDA